MEYESEFAPMKQWRTWLSMIALSALGPTLLYASPWGPGRSIEAAAKWLLLYPAWLVLSFIWLGPGILLATRLRFRLFCITVPAVAILVEIIRSGISHWPPSLWWPSIITGRLAPATSSLFGYRLEAWDGYIYSIRPGLIESLAAASVFVLLCIARPKLAFQQARQK